MKYSDFVKEVASAAQVSQTDAKRVLECAKNILKETVNSGDEVVLNGIGKFSKKERSSRSGFNPVTKQKIEIPSIKTVTFKVAKEFKDYINK